MERLLNQIDHALNPYEKKYRLHGQRRWNLDLQFAHLKSALLQLLHELNHSRMLQMQNVKHQSAQLLDAVHVHAVQ
jgi:hypothetical protein